MHREQQKGLGYSAALHLLIIVVFISGLPSFMKKNAIPQSVTVSVDILPFSEISNMKLSEDKLDKEEKTKPIVEEEKKPQLPKPEEQTLPPPPPPPPEPVPDKKKDETAKKPDKNPEQKPKKAKEEDLEAVLKKLRAQADKDKQAKEKEQKDKEQKEKAEQEKAAQKSKDAKEADEATTRIKSKNSQYDATLPLSITEMDLIRSQIAKCWNVPAGAKNAHELSISLRVQLAEDGSLVHVELADESKARYSSDSFFQAASDSAMRAVRQCSPLKNLPPEKYATWRDIIMTFDPKELLY